MTGMQPAATASKRRRLDSVSPLGQKQNLKGRDREIVFGWYKAASVCIILIWV